MNKTSTNQQHFLSFLNLPKLRPWRELAVLGIMVMELSWGVPWFRSLTGATNAAPPLQVLFTLGGMMTASYWLVKLLANLRLQMRLRYGIMGIMLVIASLVGLNLLLYNAAEFAYAEIIRRPMAGIMEIRALIRDEFVIIMAVLLACWRGSSLANEKIGPTNIIRGFQVGVLMLIGFVFVNTMLTGETVGNFMHVFLSAGLLAMGAARVSVLSFLRGGTRNPFDRRWFAGLCLSVIGAVGLAAAVAALATGEDALLGFLPKMFVGAIMAIALIILTPILIALLYLLYNATNVFQDPNSSFAKALTTIVDSLQEMIDQMSETMAGIFQILDPVMAFLERGGPAIKFISLWAVVLITALIVMLALQIRARYQRALQDEEHESILQRGDLLRMLRIALRKRLKNAAERLTRAADFRHRQRLQAAAKIRRIYARLMDLCDDLGHSRPTAQTPLEFLPALQTLLPDTRQELALITRAYVHVRYGELPENQHEMAEVETAWKRVKQSGQEYKQEAAKSTKNTKKDGESQIEV